MLPTQCLSCYSCVRTWNSFCLNKTEVEPWNERYSLYSESGVIIPILASAHNTHTLTTLWDILPACTQPQGIDYYTDQRALSELTLECAVTLTSRAYSDLHDRVLVDTRKGKQRHFPTNCDYERSYRCDLFRLLSDEPSYIWTLAKCIYLRYTRLNTFKQSILAMTF